MADLPSDMCIFLKNEYENLGNGDLVIVVPIGRRNVKCSNINQKANLVLYTDDTSGIRSKKWNKNETWLFKLAGIRKELANKDYNIHFICISNTCSSLEMSEVVVDDITSVSKKGIRCSLGTTGKSVLAIPVVLFTAADNPMHSELSCHIGTSGTYCSCRCLMSKSFGVPDDLVKYLSQPVSPRSWIDINNLVRSQVDSAIRSAMKGDNREPKPISKAELKGVKCRYFEVISVKNLFCYNFILEA